MGSSSNEKENTDKEYVLRTEPSSFANTHDPRQVTEPQSPYLSLRMD